jgi:hypothetical protein
MIECTKCGKQVDETVKFCPECGTALGEQLKKNVNQIKNIFALLGGILIGLGGGFFLTSKTISIDNSRWIDKGYVPIQGDPIGSVYQVVILGIVLVGLGIGLEVFSILYGRKSYV